MDDSKDDKQMSTSSPSVEWKRPMGHPQLYWMKTVHVQNDLDCHRLSWTKAVDVAQNPPLWCVNCHMGWHMPPDTCEHTPP